MHFAARKADGTAAPLATRGGNQVAAACCNVVQRQVDGGYAMGGGVVRARSRRQRAIEQSGNGATMHLAAAVGLGRLETHAHLGHVVADALAA